VKFGFDIHGVIDSNPELYSALTKALVAAGHEVHVITGVRLPSVKDDLEKWDIDYTHFFSIYQQLLDQGFERTGGDELHPQFPDEPWDRAKGQYCERVGIDMHIDDTPGYEPHFDSCIFLLQGLNK
jgi:hypothetical protein